MVVESSVKYGQEHGKNLIKIAKRLLSNQNLCKLLVNTDLDPLNTKTHPDIINSIELLHKNILVIPFIKADEQNNESKIVIMYKNSQISLDNPDNELIYFVIEVYSPFSEWLITGDTLRPYAIMAEIRKSIQDVKINGLGEINYVGFDEKDLTDEMGVYRLEFRINAFS